MFPKSSMTLSTKRNLQDVRPRHTLYKNWQITLISGVFPPLYAGRVWIGILQETSEFTMSHGAHAMPTS